MSEHADKGTATGAAAAGAAVGAAVDVEAVPAARARQLWHLLEPLHALLYYAPEVFEESAALGYDPSDRWPSYFPLRAAPLGAAGPERVTSAFYSFAPHMGTEHIESAWQVATPQQVLDARLRGVDRAYRAILGDRVDRPELAEAAALARRAAEAAGTAGRPLAAANAALPWPEAPHLQLWHAATILREHRGDGHLAALLLADLDPVESLVSFAAMGAASVERFESRGWRPEQWSAAAARLAGRGLLAPDGTATEAGLALRRRVEEDTDRLAAAPWQSLGGTGVDRLTELLGDYWVAVLSTGLLPSESTLGIGKV
ncbi:SCO6745 family protein [Streptomyces sp. IBSBF 2390]|uniref:SCO6745 family protein n=1 Tax=Streptomyces sp. IBSBF 2390 TaxID=2903533 RepID=UPI002FDBEE8B